MTLKQALQHARQILQSHSIENASLTAEVLLRHTLNLSRVQLFQVIDRELKPDQEKTFQSVIQRHLEGEPVAYITGHKEFYGIDFYADPRALIPRPETELLVEKALELARTQGISTAADIGTGCGAIAIALALKLPQVKIYATDISASALELAFDNCRQHKVHDRVRLLSGDLLEPLPEPVDLVIANLPYVRESDIDISCSLSYEPRPALDGGADGLYQIRRFCVQAAGKVNPGGAILLEFGEGQGEAVTALLHSGFPSARIEVIKDLAGLARAACVILSQ